MKFVALLTGFGDGCDYTIDCNKSFKIFEAENQAEAVEKCKEIYEYYGGSYGEPKIEKIDLLTFVDHIIVPLK